MRDLQAKSAHLNPLTLMARIETGLKSMASSDSP